MKFALRSYKCAQSTVVIGFPTTTKVILLGLPSDRCAVPNKHFLSQVHFLAYVFAPSDTLRKSMDVANVTRNPSTRASLLHRLSTTTVLCGRWKFGSILMIRMCRMVRPMSRHNKKVHQCLLAKTDVCTSVTSTSPSRRPGHHASMLMCWGTGVRCY